jgi:flagellar biosynthesis chaperone FliJ
MFCSECGTHVQDGDHFCNSCGAPLQAPGGIVQQPDIPMPPAAATSSPSIPAAPKTSRGSSSNKPQDPYKDQIQQLKLQIRQLKLDLKQITTNMASTRSQYYETNAFLPWGLRRGEKIIEDLRLLGPQQQKQRLQQQIMQLERQLLALQQAQAQWKAQQLRSET